MRRKHYTKGGLDVTDIQTQLEDSVVHPSPACRRSAGPCRPGTLPALASFMPTPLARLPFPSLLVASENDPYASIEAAAAFASQWGSEFVNVGAEGHINVDSGHGPWPMGQLHFQRFQEQVRSRALVA